MNHTFKLQGDRILIEVLPPETKTLTGIIIPEVAKDKPHKGTVIAVGPGTKEDPMKLNEGEVVLYGKHAGMPVNVEGKDYLIMRECDVFMVL